MKLRQPTAQSELAKKMLPWRERRSARDLVMKLGEGKNLVVLLVDGLMDGWMDGREEGRMFLFCWFDLGQGDDDLPCAFGKLVVCPVVEDLWGLLLARGLVGLLDCLYLPNGGYPHPPCSALLS